MTALFYIVTSRYSTYSERIERKVSWQPVKPVASES
jgi:hypothetical protein